jgi:hypothetical protein
MCSSSYSTRSCGVVDSLQQYLHDRLTTVCSTWWEVKCGVWSTLWISCSQQYTSCMQQWYLDTHTTMWTRYSKVYSPGSPILVNFYHYCTTAYSWSSWPCLTTYHTSIPLNPISFNPWWLQVIFVLDKVTLKQVFSDLFSFLLNMTCWYINFSCKNHCNCIFSLIFIR